MLTTSIGLTIAFSCVFELRSLRIHVPQKLQVLLLLLHVQPGDSEQRSTRTTLIMLCNILFMAPRIKMKVILNLHWSEFA